MARKKKSAKPQYVRTKRKKEPTVPIAVRRSISVLLLFLLLGGLVYGIQKGLQHIHAALLYKNPRFEIQHLDISSDGRLSEDQIREFIKVSEGQNLFAADFNDIETRLKKVSQIESVYLERQLPDTLIVRVKERLPLARVQSDKPSQYPFLVDRFGVVLPPRQSASTLPLIKGIQEKLKPGLSLKDPDVKTALDIIGLSENMSCLRNHVRIKSLSLNNPDFIYMELDGGIMVRMPRVSLRSRLNKLATTLQIANEQGRQIQEIDLTLDSPNTPVRLLSTPRK
jgi:cell division septal protein FtsQ